MLKVKGGKGGQRGHGKSRLMKKCEGWIEKGRCTLPIKVECWRKSDCCLAEVNPATITCWGCYKILNIDVSLSPTET